jgi:hypothetical protein
MKFLDHSLCIASILALAGASEEKRDFLRKQVATDADDVPQQRELLPKLLDPCRLINAQFQGQVNCVCDVSLFTGSVAFTCEYAKPICAASNTLCGTPLYIGSVDILKTQATSQICVGSLTAAGALNIGDLCVDLTLNPTNNQILSCEASLGSLACATCRPCKGGISLNCANVVPGALDTCTPVALVTGVTGTKNKVKPFLPNFVITP